MHNCASGCADMLSDWEMIPSFERDLLMINRILSKVMSVMDNYKLATFIEEPHLTEVVKGGGSISKSVIRFPHFLCRMTHFGALVPQIHLMLCVKDH